MKKFKIMFWLGLIMLAAIVLAIENELYPLAVQSLENTEKTSFFWISLIMFIISAILVGISYDVPTKADDEFKPN